MARSTLTARVLLGVLVLSAAAQAVSASTSIQWVSYTASGAGAITSVNQTTGRIVGTVAGATPIVVTPTKPFNIISAFAEDQVSSRPLVAICVGIQTVCIRPQRDLDMGIPSARATMSDTTMSWPAGTSVYIFVLSAGTDASHLPTYATGGLLGVSYALSPQ